jgi:hypothetical protein
MSLVPTTFLRDSDFSKEMLRGIANAQMGILLNQMRLGKLNCARRVVEYASGVVITCTVNFRDRHLDIIVPENLGGENIREEYVVGFICHPGAAHAYDQVQDGTRDGNRVVYWAKDQWKTQLKVVKITTTDLLGNVISVNYARDEYGNIDWKGPKQDPDKDPDQFYRKILTWKGPPSRYFPLGLQDDIEGVTTTDHVIEGLLGDTIYTTPFTGNVYEHGLVMAKMPALYWPLGLNDKHEAQVLGAAYREVDGKLVVVVKTCYNTYPRFKEPTEMVSTWQVHRNGLFYQEWLEDKNGADAQVLELGLEYETVEVPDPGRAYWFEVLIREPGPSLAGWNRLLQISTGGTMPDTNWFFSEDGSKIVSVMHGVLHKVEIALVDGISSATHTTEALVTATASIAGTNTTVGTNEYEDIAEHFPSANLWEGGSRRSDFFAYEVGSAEYTSYIAPFITPVNGLKNVYNITDTIDRSGEITIAADYKENILVLATKVISGEEASSRYHVVNNSIKGPVKWALWYNPVDHIPQFTWQWSFAGTGQSLHVGERVWLALTEMCNPTITYSISDGTIDADGTILSLPCTPCDLEVIINIVAESAEGTIDESMGFVIPPQGDRTSETTIANCSTGNYTQSGYKCENGEKTTVYWESVEQVGTVMTAAAWEAQYRTTGQWGEPEWDFTGVDYNIWIKVPARYSFCKHDGNAIAAWVYNPSLVGCGPSVYSAANGYYEVKTACFNVSGYWYYNKLYFYANKAPCSCDDWLPDSYLAGLNVEVPASFTSNGKTYNNKVNKVVREYCA